MLRLLVVSCILMLAVISSQGKVPSTLPFTSIRVKGELQERLERNFQRLEEEKYQPHKVFLSMQQSGDWPGDTEGRTILGLVMDAQASHRSPLYLDEIMHRLPEHLNEFGYMGPVFHDCLHEQQLSGNGWLLRGLCEYYLWRKDERVLDMIKNISEQLFISGKDYYGDYPIDPMARQTGVGKASGNISQHIDRWQLSSDIGCVFIGMDGLIQAYAILSDDKLKPVIESLISRFLQIDLLGIKAQTHATLTACRGLVRYADITGDERYILEAEKRFLLYAENGMTENYENYNWFGRYETWTEPCAIIDSYMLAVQLWQHTLKFKYLELAEKIYYNAICHTQRYNGGFGCDNCPGITQNTDDLDIHIPEAHWCCTMRGGEGLSRVAEYTAFVDDKHIFVPFYRNADFTYNSGNKMLSIEERTDYPFAETVTFSIKQNSMGKLALCLPHYSWMESISVKVNNKLLTCPEQDGFIVLTRRFRSWDIISVSFKMKTGCGKTINPYNTSVDDRTAFYGPLQLCVRDSTKIILPSDACIERRSNGKFYLRGTQIQFGTIYHLMTPEVWKPKHSAWQMLFKAH